MLSSASPNQVALESDHPCSGCAVRDCAICAVLESDELGAFRRLGWALGFGPGQTIFHQGDPANRVFTVTEGTVKLYRLFPDGRRQVTGFVYPGGFLGLSLDAEHAFSAEALDDVRLCSFPRNRFREFVDDWPPMERRLYAFAAHELGIAQEQMLLLGRKAALERLATFFIQQLDRADPDGDHQAGSFDLAMTRSDIADYLGLTKETVSRLLARLRQSRLIRLSALNRVEVIDRQGLARLAEGNDGQSARSPGNTRPRSPPDAPVDWR